MNNDQLQLLVLVLVVTFAPGVPAFILYSKLPARTIVTGPFKGLQVQLTGAFAGYFLVLLVTVGFVFTYMGNVHRWAAQQPYDTWMVKGQIIFGPGGPDVRPADAMITFSPPLLDIHADGSFSTVLPVQTGMPGSATTMQIERAPYTTAVVHLSKDAEGSGYGTSYQIVVDSARHVINIVTPITLGVAPSRYGATPGYQPQLVPGTP